MIFRVITCRCRKKKCLLYFTIDEIRRRRRWRGEQNKRRKKLHTKQHYFPSCLLKALFGCPFAVFHSVVAIWTKSKKSETQTVRKIRGITLLTSVNMLMKMFLLKWFQCKRFTAEKMLKNSKTSFPMGNSIGSFT